MAKSKKEKMVVEESDTVSVLPDESNTPVQEYVSIPDVPAQMDEIKVDNSIAEEPKKETEIEFLQRILKIQHIGGFGRHLDELINNRIKSIS